MAIDQVSHFTTYTQIGNVPLAAHEGANGPRLAEIETRKFGSDGAREELGEERDDTQQDCVPPGDPVIQKAQVRLETGKDEVLEKASQPHHTELDIEGEDRSNGIPSRTSGRKRMLTKSSSLSTSPIAKPLS